MTEGEVHLDIARREREQCCKDVCPYCGKVPAFRLEIVGLDMAAQWYHSESDTVTGSSLFCLANTIRERAWKEANQ
jgi:hypothetical protein